MNLIIILNIALVLSYVGRIVNAFKIYTKVYGLNFNDALCFVLDYKRLIFDASIELFREYINFKYAFGSLNLEVYSKVLYCLIFFRVLVKIIDNFRTIK